MPIVAAAVCPHPPLLVPEIAAGAAAELDDLRAACDAAIDRLYAAGPDRLVVIGSGTDTGPVGGVWHVSFAPWGVPLRIGTGGRRLPLGLAVGVWLLDRRGAGPDGLYSVAATEPPQQCARLGARLAAAGDRVALLVMGDGSACRGEGAPDHDDQRCATYDRRVATALATADAGALRDLDPGLSQALLVAGRPAWQVLAGAAGPGWRGELCYDAAPYGVTYLVAVWEPA